MLNETSTVQDLLDEIQVAKEKLIKQKKIKKIRNLPDISDEEEPFKIPKNWKWMRLGEVIQIINGDRGKNYPSKKELKETGNIPFISALNIKNNTISNEHLLYVDKERYDVLRSGKLSKGDIVLCIRGSLGKNGRYPYECGAIASSLVIIRSYLNVDGIYRYISLYLNSILFQKELSKYDNGTAQPNLGAKDLALFAVPVPPLSEQQRLVARIESLFAKLDAAKEQAQSVLDSHETRKAALLHAAFTGKLTAKWRDGQSTKSFSWKPISFEDCIEKMQNGLSKRKGDAGEYVNVLRLTNIAPEGLSFQDMRKILLTSDEKEKYKLAPEDVLMVRVNGSKDNVGKQLYIDKKDADNQLTFCDHLIRIHYNEQLVAPQFMVYFSHTMQYKSYVEKNMVSSAGQNTISRKGMKNLSLMLPSLPEQQAIVRILDRLLAREQRARQAAEETLTAIDRMKQSILARAFRGEL